MYGVCRDIQHPAILYEFMANGSLMECILGKNPVSWNFTVHSIHHYSLYHCLVYKGARYFGDIQMRIKNLYEGCCGLAYLHCTTGGMPLVVHLDIKRWIAGMLVGLCDADDKFIVHQLQLQHSHGRSFHSQIGGFWFCQTFPSTTRREKFCTQLYSMWHRWLYSTRLPD